MDHNLARIRHVALLTPLVGTPMDLVSVTLVTEDTHQKNECLIGLKTDTPSVEIRIMI
jgi:hypothetical protein